MCTVNPQCRVHQCYKCSEDTEYYCESCNYDLCPSCKENHGNDLNTVDHQIVTYPRKVKCTPKVETCIRHHNIPYQRYCLLCKIPICCHCTEHRKNTKSNMLEHHMRQRYTRLEKKITLLEVRLLLTDVFA